MQYSSDDIVVHNWPDIKKTSDDKWVREWDITFKNPISEQINLESSSRSLSYWGYEVSVMKINSRHLKITVVTNDSNREDYLCFNTYKMFEEIDILFGEIDSIQDQPRNLWNPWLRRKKFPNADYKLSRIIIRTLEVGLRIDSEKGFIFFGMDEVNNLLLEGGKVVLIEPGGVITQELGNDAEGVKFTLIGFVIAVNIEQRETGIIAR